MKTIGMVISGLGILFAVWLFGYMFIHSIMDIIHGFQAGDAGTIAWGIFTWAFKELFAVVVGVALFFLGVLVGSVK